MRTWLKLMFDERFRERMNYARYIRADRLKRDEARARGDQEDARYYQFSAQVTRDSRWVSFTLSR